MKKLIRAFLIALLMALITCCSGCGGNAAPTEEEIFCKTIHDFGDLRVDQLTEAEDSNFVVYAAGVQEITCSAHANVLVEWDEEERVYTFSHPDEQLLAMEEGDVFWAAATAENPTGIVVKMKKMEVTGDTVKVYSEEVALEDLFVYADILTDISLENVPVESAQLSHDSEIMGESADQIGADTTEEDVLEPPASFDGTIPVNYSLSHNLNIRREAVTVTGELNHTLHSVTVKFRYDEESGYLYTGVWCDISSNDNIQIKASGNAINQQIKLTSVPIPVCGALFVNVNAAFQVKLAGEISGRTVFRDRWTKGVLFDNGTWNKVDDQTVKSSADSEFDALKGSFEVGLDLRPTLSIGPIGGVYASIYAGFEASASQTYSDETDYKEGEDFIHDCSVCMDGQIDVLTRLGCGLDIYLKAKSNIDTTYIDLTLAEGRFKINGSDFYISMDNEDGDAVEFGWGNCPHLRWKTTVTLLDVHGDPAAGGTVKTTYPNGKEASTGTDGAGMGVLWLPDGDNVLRGSCMGQTNSMTVRVDGHPGNATLRLEDKRQIFVVHNYTDLDLQVDLPGTDFSEVYELIYQAYPDAVWVDDDEFYTKEFAEENGVSPGDIVIDLYATIFSQDHKSYTYDDIEFWVGIVLLPQDDGETELNGIKIIWTYRISSYILAHVKYGDMPGGIVDNAVSYWNIGGLLEKVEIRNTERYWKGLQYDKQYRIIETGTEWTEDIWVDPAPDYGATNGDEYSQNLPLYRPLIANYILRGFPVLELLWENEWNDYQGNLIPADSTQQSAA